MLQFRLKRIRSLKDSDEKVKTVTNQFRRGLITDEERYDRVISIWSDAKEEITTILMNSLQKFNSINMMVESKARGNKSQITQLAVCVV